MSRARDPQFRNLRVKRRGGFYEVTCGDVYFQVERVPYRRQWVKKQWYGPTQGWGEQSDCSENTLRSCKEDIIDEGWCGGADYGPD
jgi:hypothetical protein